MLLTILRQVAEWVGWITILAAIWFVAWAAWPWRRAGTSTRSNRWETMNDHTPKPPVKSP